MAFMQPLDFKALLINTLTGSTELFTFVAIIVISMASARYRIPDLVFVAFLGLFAILFSEYIGGLYLLALILTGFGVFKGLSKLFK